MLPDDVCVLQPELDDSTAPLAGHGTTPESEYLAGEQSDDERRCEQASMDAFLADVYADEPPMTDAELEALYLADMSRAMASDRVDPAMQQAAAMSWALSRCLGRSLPEIA